MSIAARGRLERRSSTARDSIRRRSDRARAREAIGVEIDGVAYVGFPTPSRKLEFYSKTLKDWKWPEYCDSDLHPQVMCIATISIRAKGEMLLLPTFRLPTLIHTRSGNAKWLYEISHRNPLWIHPRTRDDSASTTGDLLKVHTEIGYFVDKVWVDRGNPARRDRMLASSRALAPATRTPGARDGRRRWSISSKGQPGKWMMRQMHGIRPFKSADPDSERVWWEDAGVHQNLIFPVQPDP